MMHFRRYIENIMKRSQEYKKYVDTLEKDFIKKQEAFTKKLDEMQATYTESYIKQYARNNNPRKAVEEEFLKERTLLIEHNQHFITLLKAEIEKAFQGDVSSVFANKITAILQTGIKLSDSEIKMLENEAGSYWERRLVNEIAMKRTMEVQEFDAEKGSQMVEKSNSYAYVKLPDYDETMKEFFSFNGLVDAISDYAGWNNTFVKTLADPNDTRRPLFDTRDLKYTNAYVITSKMGRERADKLITKLCEVEAAFPKTVVKSLSPGEQALIDVSLHPTESLAMRNMKAVEKAKSDWLWKDMLLRDDRYREVVKAKCGE